MPFSREHTLKYYATDKELADDIVKAYGMVINDLYEAGCRNIKLDDCTWEMMADKSGHLAYGTTQSGLIEIQKAHKDINNKVIANAPKDIVINTHVCRGNFHSTYANSGAYDPVAEKYIPLDRLYLSPQCGFASCEIGNKLTEEEQWAKLKLVKEIAEEILG